MKLLIYLLTFLLAPFAIHAQSGPSVLIVTAHPDDETMFPVTVFKITRELKGSADLALITDASGGFNGMVASRYYGMNMLDSLVGRKHLPLIRKREMMRAGEVMGIGNFFFLDQRDDFYNLDPRPYLTGVRWDAALVNRRLDEILARGQYDYVFCLVPDAGQHAHHKSASILALQAVGRFKGPKKPLVLGGRSLNKGYTFRFSELDGFPITRIAASAPVFEYDRSRSFGEAGKHSYMIVADWVKAEHKSQSGDMNASMHRGELETFWYFDLNGPTGLEKTRSLFEQLRAADLK